MEDNQETKALADLIQNPQEISNIINNPADNGVKFYQSLRNKDKQYVAFAAGIGLIAYGLFLGKSSKSKSTSTHSKSKSKGNSSTALTPPVSADTDLPGNTGSPGVDNANTY